MDDQYRLGRLGNSELLSELSALVRQSNELTAQVLAHLVELEERMLHLELGFASVFSYCVEALGMSEGAAGRRVAAARVCRRFAGAFERVARGQLHLCALCALAPHLTADNATELMDACRGKPRRQVEELLAVRFPRPDVREQIRRLPARTAMVVTEQASPVAQAVELRTPPPDSVEASSVQTLGQPPATSENPPSPPTDPVATRDAQSSLTESAESPDPRRRTRELEPLSADRFGVHFTADAELRDLIERARALASHRLPNGDLAGLMKLMATSFVRQEEKQRFGIGARARRNTSRTQVESKTEPSTKADAPRPNQTVVDPLVKSSQPNQVTPPGGANRGAPYGATPALPRSPEASQGCGVRQSRERTRYLSADARREVHERDGGRCAFVSTSGRRCDARAFMQLDHVIPFARRGRNEVSNLRLLCRAHNRYYARQCFGALHLAAKIAVKRARTSGP